MPYLVIDLQKDSLNPSITTTNLLRKAMVVSKKLKISDFEQWINHELEGYYGSDKDLPSYRIVTGELRGLNPYRGWIPTSFQGNQKIQELVTRRGVFDTIPELEYLIADESKELCLTFNAELEHTLGKMFGFNTKYQLFMSKSQFQGILETVRTTILNWSLKLESDGILGDEMMFTYEEKEIASKMNYTVNYFFGHVTNSQIQQNTANSTQKQK